MDFLLGEGLNAAYDKEMIKRLDQVEQLPDAEKQRIFHYMDLVIRDYKTKATYSNKQKHESRPMPGTHAFVCP